MKKATREEISRELMEMGCELPVSAESKGFGVPDGYFDRLSIDIRDRITAEKSSPNARPVSIALIPRRLAYAMVAVMVLLAFSVSLFLIDRGTDNGYLSEADHVWQEDYFTLYASMDPLYFYELVLEEPQNADRSEAAASGINEVEEEAILQYLYNTSEFYNITLEDLTMPEEGVANGS